ncbi:MAG: hypothetical protein WDN44_07495 [Sphingomonas sp.]
MTPRSPRRPAAATDEVRTARLIEAGRSVSTSVIAPLPATVAALELAVQALRATFDTARANLAALHAGRERHRRAAPGRSPPSCRAMQRSTSPLSSLRPHRAAIRALAETLRDRARAIAADVARAARRLRRGDDALSRPPPAGKAAGRAGNGDPRIARRILCAAPRVPPRARAQRRMGQGLGRARAAARPF